MKAIIFGITGQDGSYLAELLLEKDYEVVGVTRRVSVPTLNRIEHVLPKIKIVEGDITDAFSVSNIINEEDDIKFYQASSSEMFGKNYSLREQFVDILKYQDEKTPFAPQSPYAIAKLAAHHLVRNYRDSYGIFACSGILFNHESERRGEKFVTRKITKWIGEFKNWARSTGFTGNPPNGNDLLLALDNSTFPKLRLGNLSAKRDWGHAEDYVRAMWEMMQHETPNDYVVATGETHSVRDFLDVAFKHVGIDDWEDLVVIDPEFYRPSEVDYLLGIPAKAKRVLGWEPEISFEKLAERMVDSDVEAARLRRPDIQRV